jgi:hypothetical protein
LRPVEYYNYDPLMHTGHFALSDGSSGSYSSNSLTLHTAEGEQHFRLRLEAQEFARLHQSLRQGASTSDAFTAVFRGYN